MLVHFLPRKEFETVLLCSCVPYSDLARLSLSRSGFLPLSPPLPFTSNHHLPPVFSHPTRDSGSFLIRPNLTGTVHKKARLRCAFAVRRLYFSPTPSFSLSLYTTSTFILRLVSRPHFFPSLLWLNPPWPPHRRQPHQQLSASWAPFKFFS